MHIAQRGNFTGQPKSMQTRGEVLEDPDGMDDFECVRCEGRISHPPVVVMLKPLLPHI
jgi:hypothetical protein